MTKDEIVGSLKKYMITELYLEDVTEDDINIDTKLFDSKEGLGLDSLDAVGLVTIISKHYGVEIEEPGEARTYFTSIGTVADFILANQRPAG